MDATITMRVEVDLKPLIVKFDKLANIDKQGFLTNAGLLVEEQAKINAPNYHGELRDSITSRVENDEAIIGSNLEYAIYVHQGTGIYAVNGDGRQDVPWCWPATEEDVKRYGVPNGNGGYLNAFQNKQGEWFIRTVGQKPQPFLTQALEEKTPEIYDLLVKYTKEALK